MGYREALAWFWVQIACVSISVVTVWWSPLAHVGSFVLGLVTAACANEAVRNYRIARAARKAT